MHITNLKSSSFPRQPTRSQGTKSTLVGHLAQGIRLVHKLGQLTRTEKFFHHRRNGFGVNEVVRHQRLHLLKTHSLFDGPFHPHKTNAVLILEEFAHSTHAPIPEVVNIVYQGFRAFQPDKFLDGTKDVLLSERSLLKRNPFHTQPIIEFKPSHT